MTDAIIFVSAGLLLLLFRKPFARWCITYQNQNFNFNFDQEVEKRVEYLATAIAVILIGFAIWIILD